jgi:hypothetical protein
MKSMVNRRSRPFLCISCDYHYLNYENDIIFIVDKDDWENIKVFGKTFILNKEHKYPSYKYNNKDVTLLEFIYKFDMNDNIYHFKNNNSIDLRKNNVVCYPKIYSTIVEKYDIVDFIQGHYSTIGQSAYKIKNCIWKIKENEKIYMLMYCETDTLCKLCEDSYNKILEYEKTIEKKLTWYKCVNGYIQTHQPVDKKNYYMHQIIMNCYGNGRGTKNISVDHIDRNPLNNTTENLQIATRKEQEQNTKGIKEGTKRARSKNAKKLPEGITDDMVEKYVVYYHEWLNPEETKYREFFKVESHPKLGKLWVGTKSNKVTALEKLMAANKIVQDLKNDIYPVKA